MTINVNLSIFQFLPAEKLPFQSLCCRPDGLDFLSKRLLNVVGGCSCSCSCCIFGFICFIINITSDLVRISLRLFVGVKLLLVLWLWLGLRRGRSPVVWLVSPGQGVDGNVLWGWWGSHGMDGKCEVWSCSHHLKIRTDYTDCWPQFTFRETSRAIKSKHDTSHFLLLTELNNH